MPRKPKLKSQREAAEAEVAAPAPQAASVDTGPQWARLREVAARYGVSKRTAERWIKAPGIVSAKVNGIRAVDIRSVEAMFAAGVGK